MDHVDQHNQLLLTGEAAAILRFKPQTLRKMRAKGKGPPYVKNEGRGGRVLYRMSELTAWLDAHQVDLEPAADGS